MDVMLVLIGFSLAVAAGFLGAFIWALKHGQYDDLRTPAIRILFESSADRQKDKKE